MKKSITRLAIVFLAVSALLAFVGCDLTGTDSMNTLTDDSRKGKPVTTEAETVVLPVYSGATGSEVALDETEYIETYFVDENLLGTEYSLEPIEFTPESVTTTYFYLNSAGERVFVDGNDPLATHKLTTTEGYQAVYTEIVGERIIGWVSNTFNLWAGQNNDAGTVTISNDNENFYITIDTNTAADLEEVHVYVYEDASLLPDKRPAPGQAPFVVQNIYADSVVVTIPVSVLENLEDYYFIIHAALVEDAEGSADGFSLAGETAYAAGNDTPDFTGKGAWFYAVNYTLTAVIENIEWYVIETVVFEEVETWNNNGDNDGDDDDDTDNPSTGGSEETAWAGNTVGDGNAWWFYFDASDSNVQNIYAGQNLVPEATVTYDAENNMLYIDFGSYLGLQNASETIKIEGYTEIPGTRPNAGHFTIKYDTYPEGGISLDALGEFNFLGIHLDVVVFN